MRVTTIGSFPNNPKHGVSVPTWFQNPLSDSTGKYNEFWVDMDRHQDKIISAVKDVVDIQLANGVDIPTDGEIYRENYVHYFCRHLSGIDFQNTALKTMRNGATAEKVPVIIEKLVNLYPGFLSKDWKRANVSNLKITIPGPMTIMDTVLDKYYKNTSALRKCLVTIIHDELGLLVLSGCNHVQIDEPVLTRYPTLALDYGISDVEKCFGHISSYVTKYVHICCGYPTYLDEKDYDKAQTDSYVLLADRLNSSHIINAVSIEDAHKNNSFELFQKLKDKIIVLGVIDVSTSTLPLVDSAVARINKILEFIPKNNLMLAPDCGLGFFSWEDAIERLKILYLIKKRF